MASISAPRGCNDTLSPESRKWQAVESIARAVADTYGFDEIRTPIMERTELFHRGVGETSDIVHKETFTFTDRGGESMTLRPEQTAGVVRAMIEHSLLADAGSRQKVFYIGPNFRYEKPQKGRLRIHHQFGAEAFGVPNPEQDVECIQLQMAFYAACGLKGLALRLNSLGDGESKARYRDALVAHFTPFAATLSEDSQRRLAENPMRILDSKDPRDQPAIAAAPPANQSLSDKSRTHFDRVCQLLGEFAIPFTVDGRLVRGFDYYTDTLWEVTAEGLGAQSAVGGGGRYDNLVALLGGKPTPGVGFGSGLERLLIALDTQNSPLPVPERVNIFLIAQSEAARPALLKLAATFRAAGLRTDLDLTGRAMKSQMKLADRIGATHAIIVGDSELAAGTANLKDLATGEQSTHPLPDLVAQFIA
jgi:histidyl-tRNA synthetase